MKNPFSHWKDAYPLARLFKFFSCLQMLPLKRIKIGEVSGQNMSLI
jgi:hypothetical protein